MTKPQIDPKKTKWDSKECVSVKKLILNKGI